MGTLDRGAPQAGATAEPLPDDRRDAAVDALTDTGTTLPAAATLTVGELASRHGLSRSTLLYYDRIGVLRPSGRSAAGYRRYSGVDDRRLAAICRYRRAGLSLAEIRALLDLTGGESDLAKALLARFEAIDREVRVLREQQRFILAYLGSDQRPVSLSALTADRFVELLEAAGVSADQRAHWHALFECSDADGHQAFLEYLCLPDDVIGQIRRSVRGPAHRLG